MNYFNKLKKNNLCISKQATGGNKIADLTTAHKHKHAKSKFHLAEHQYHKFSSEKLCHLFDTSFQHGLTSDKAQMLLLKHGKNEMKKPSTHVMAKLFKYCFSGFCWLLWIGSLICFIAWKPIGDPPDVTNLGLAILLLLVIGLQAVFEAFQDWSSSKVMKSIKNLIPSDATVIRNGIECKVTVSELVPGDIVMLYNGAKVPADLRLIETNDLKFDRSMLTGESEAIDGYVSYTDDNYNESKNIAFMTTLVTNGNGKGVVTSTGVHTMIGSIANIALNSKQKPTTLQLEIKNFVRLIAILALSTVFVCLIVWYAWIHRFYPKHIQVSEMMVNTIAILVAFIPTGLPVSVTLSLLLVARSMAKNKVLVKNLTTVETLSCVNVIASDKTGTLTQNKMYVTNAAAGLTVISSLSITDSNNSALQLFNICILCNEAKFEEEDLVKPVQERRTSGTATDGAILKYAATELKVDQVDKEYTVLKGIPFNSRNKWMATIFKSANNLVDHEDCFNMKNDECIISIKGK